MNLVNTTLNSAWRNTGALGVETVLESPRFGQMLEFSAWMA